MRVFIFSALTAVALIACGTGVDDTFNPPSYSAYRVESLVVHWASDSNTTGEIGVWRRSIAVDSFTVTIDRTTLTFAPQVGRARTPYPDTVLSFGPGALHTVRVQALGELDVSVIGILPGVFAVDSLWPAHGGPGDSLYVGTSASSAADGYLVYVEPPAGTDARGYVGELGPGVFGPECVVPASAFLDRNSGAHVTGTYNVHLIAWNKAFLSSDTLTFDVPDSVSDGDLPGDVVGAIAFATVLPAIEYESWGDYRFDVTVAHDAGNLPAAAGWVDVDGSTFSTAAVLFAGAQAPYDPASGAYWLGSPPLSFGPGATVEVVIGTTLPGFDDTFAVLLPGAVAAPVVSPDTIHVAQSVQAAWSSVSDADGYVVQVTSATEAAPYAAQTGDTTLTIPAEAFADAGGGTVYGDYLVAVLAYSGGFTNPPNWTGPLPAGFPAGATRPDSLGLSAAGVRSSRSTVHVVP